MSNALLLTHLLEEFLVEIQLRIYSIRTLESVKDNNGLFLRYIESEFGITTLEKLLHVHIREYIRYKQPLGLKSTYISTSKLKPSIIMIGGIFV